MKVTAQSWIGFLADVSSFLGGFALLFWLDWRIGLAILLIGVSGWQRWQLWRIRYLIDEALAERGSKKE